MAATGSVKNPNPPRHQDRMDAVPGHGPDQGFGAGAQRHRGQGYLERPLLKPLEHRHALLQRLGEVDLAPHGAFGDGGGVFLAARPRRQLVQGFGGDDGAIHVGDEKRFPPPGGGLRQQVHRRPRQGLAHGCFRGLRIGARKRDIAGFAR